MSVLCSLLVLAATLSTLVACGSVVAVRLSVINRPPYYTMSTSFHIPLGFLITKIVLCTNFFRLGGNTFVPLYRLMHKSVQPDDGLRSQTRATSLRLIVAILFSVPFRSVARFLAEDRMPNLLPVYRANTMTILETVQISYSFGGILLRVRSLSSSVTTQSVSSL